MTNKIKKKAYQAPTFTKEEMFERFTLACAKVGKECGKGAKDS
jgi:hypothetical protein